jgi:hypothetical protein
MDLNAGIHIPAWDAPTRTTVFVALELPKEHGFGCAIRLGVWRGLQALVTRVLPTKVQAGPLITFLTEGRTVPAELVVVPATICFWRVVRERLPAASLEVDAASTVTATTPANPRRHKGLTAVRNMPETITSIRERGTSPDHVTSADETLRFGFTGYQGHAIRAPHQPGTSQTANRQNLVHVLFEGFLSTKYRRKKLDKSLIKSGSIYVEEGNPQKSWGKAHNKEYTHGQGSRN